MKPVRGIVRPAIQGALCGLALGLAAIGWIERRTRHHDRRRCGHCPHTACPHCPLYGPRTLP